MAEVKWIKIVVDIFDDEKILLIESLPEADSIIVCWFKLLCLAGKQNNSGVLMLNERIPYTEEMLATIFRRPLQTVRLALETFERFGMVEIVNGTITIPKWGKHQQLEKSEEIKEQTRERVRKYRERQKLLSESNVTGNVTVTKCNGTELELETELESEHKSNRFVPPTVEEVESYCSERSNNVDPQSFIDFYDSKGWMIGKNKMKDWKAAVRTWEKREAEKPKKKTVTAAEYKAQKPTLTNAELWGLVDKI